VSTGRGVLARQNGLTGGRQTSTAALFVARRPDPGGRRPEGWTAGVHGLRRFSLAICTPVLHVIERIVAPLGLRVDATSPWVDARLPDGSRVQTRFLCAPFRADRLVPDPVEVPPFRDALQIVLTGILEH
jgi:hypothetical protein